MQNAFVRYGHGYETGSQGRCTAFDGFEVIASPLHQPGTGWEAAFGNEARASRVYRRPNGNGTDYSSHAIKLAKQNYDGNLYILMHHGGGREVLRVPQFYDGGDLAELILSLPERLQYSLLYTIWQTARNAIDQGRAETRDEWARAFADGRIRKKRASKTRAARVEIIPQQSTVN